MTDIKLSGSHVNRTLAYLSIPGFRREYLTSMHTEDQRTWARQLLIDYEAGRLKEIDLVPGQDSVCERCHPINRTRCTYEVEPLVLRAKTFSFGRADISELLAHFDPAEFLQEEARRDAEFRRELMQHM